MVADINYNNYNNSKIFQYENIPEQMLLSP